MTVRSYAMSIDTGGTFTDGFVSDGQHTAQVKVDTTPQDLTIGFLACVEAAADAVGHELPAFLGSLSEDPLQFHDRDQHDRRAPRARVGLIVTRGAQSSCLRHRPQGAALRSSSTRSWSGACPRRQTRAGAVVAEPGGPTSSSRSANCSSGVFGCSW